ncbi:sugar transferase [Bacteroides thetaiotaomicron]|uniref:Sugar transferase n=1 Tax=Bacteroides thetaiotaomicron TaxID=818 RepID=A0AAP3WIX7_BACT4|nr:sugar transferase [Bacteroides thetaiotaomicron]MDC2156175.1 sugar transferase [Bacteroides thetaiotaomicron]MDC2219411.1 sugar transferase [Bacteroides thetaiotaomicron]MDC2225106.1 sugar transferase [Bacteroides thetaiotaomicron]MDC2239120.1 sugar transferase [Bacteroides thetaiotaomicron]
MYKHIFKRLLDIAFSLLVFPLFGLILIPVAIAIKLDDGGPVFYKSARVGRGFQKFNMLKFRSMRVNAPDLRNVDGGTYNSANDPRVTKIGKFLRETSLDETPQILNIIKGDMSIIGPRAGDWESVDTYEDDEKDKTKVVPGLTGYCQAYFRNNASVREKRLKDAWYANNVSFLLDVKIFFKTIETVLKHENLYTN